MPSPHEHTNLTGLNDYFMFDVVVIRELYVCIYTHIQYLRLYILYIRIRILTHIKIGR